MMFGGAGTRKINPSLTTPSDGPACGTTGIPRRNSKVAHKVVT
jgi:hypothetical protein